MTLALLLAFLAASLVLYVLFGGADFGAGILELFLPRHDAEARELVSRAMAPGWEANHMWLVLAVVILFMGFPTVYTTVSVYLFVPLVAVLIGIVARGTAFTFRHYDVATPGESPILSTDGSVVYGWVFASASAWTSAWLGVTAGAVLLGRVDPAATDAVALYVAPWANAFCLAMAAFTTALFTLLAAVYLVGEAGPGPLRARFGRAAAVAATIAVLAGAAVFGTAEASGLPLIGSFFAHPLALGAFALATVLLVPFALSVRGDHPTRARLVGAAVVSLVLLGAFVAQYPVAVRLTGGAITFPDAAAPAATQAALLQALLVGSCVIFPALGYLFRVFKAGTFTR